MEQARIRVAERALTMLCLLAISDCRPQAPQLDPPPNAAAHQLRSTASGQHLLALVEAINAGDSTAIHRFGSLHYASIALEQSGGFERLHSRWLEISQNYGPVMVDSVMSTTDLETTAWLRGTISHAWLFVRLGTDSAPARKVTRIGLGRGITPPYADARATAVAEAELPSHIDAYMSGLARADLFSGVVLLARNGVPILERVYGVADKNRAQPFTMDSPFDIASIGKMFTVISIMQLAEHGRLRLTDTVGRYVPELPKAVGNRITVSQLLEHSSGLGELGPSIDSAMKKAATVGEMIRLLTDTTLAFPPGTNVRYSNRGYVILGAIIERASGDSYGDYIRDHIFRPAGMTRTGLFAADRIPADRARRYTRFPTLRSPFTPGPRVEFRPSDDLAAGPHGGAYSTARDLLRFTNGISAGTLLSPTSLETITAPGQGGRAKGFDVGGEGRRRYYGHAGGTPGMNSLLRAFPELGYTLIVLSNYDVGANISGPYLTSLFR